MSLTIEEIKRREAILREEIAEREKLLAAYATVRADFGRQHGSLPLGAVAPASITAATAPTSAELLAADTIAPAPTLAAAGGNLNGSPGASIPPSSGVRPGAHAGQGETVAWAIEQMTEDYTLHNLGALLKREGFFLSPEAISVVLSRLKWRGEIEEVKRGGGRTPAVFRKPDRLVADEITPPAPENPGNDIGETTN